ncbi:MAG: hypothetical protein EA371_00850 [Gammaproteobacteria bacterium]|nr:MAG: hypothetical protein EA371_00850 [Gammaproteobacteria bacterium]
MTRQILLAGLGYTTTRLAQRLDASGVAWRAHSASGRCGSMPLDLDGPCAGALAVEDHAIVYAIPPPPAGEYDERVARWLGLLEGRPERIVYLSTTAVYGDRPGERLDENAEIRPAQARARRRADAERRLGEWCAAREVPLLVLRLPAIYGPGRLPLERLRRGDPVLDPALSPPSYRVHVDDLVTAIERALDPESPGGTYLVRDDSRWSLGQWFLTVAELAGLPPPECVDLDSARRRLSPAMLGFMMETRELDDTRTRQVLGLTPRYANPVAGIRASLTDRAADSTQPQAERGG